MEGCEFTKDYAEGSSLEGIEVNDKFNFSKSNQGNWLLGKLNKGLDSKITSRVNFGCTTKETGLFQSQKADGIIGINWKSYFL